MAQTTTQQIFIGVITGVTVMLVASYFQRKITPPPVAKEEEKNWYSEVYKDVYGWFG